MRKVHYIYQMTRASEADGRECLVAIASDLPKPPHINPLVYMQEIGTAPHEVDGVMHYTLVKVRGEGPDRIVVSGDYPVLVYSEVYSSGEFGRKELK